MGHFKLWARGPSNCITEAQLHVTRHDSLKALKSYRNTSPLWDHILYLRTFKGTVPPGPRRDVLPPHVSFGQAPKFNRHNCTPPSRWKNSTVSKEEFDHALCGKRSPGCEFKDKDGLVGAEWWSKATGRGHNTTATCSCFEQLLCPVLVARLTYWHYCTVSDWK